MNYVEIGSSGIKVSGLSLGTWGMGGGQSWFNESNDAQSVNTIRKAAEHGINFFDTAPVYGLGHAEKLVGKAIAGQRDKYIISTKCSVQWRTQRGEFMYERDGKNIYKCFLRDSVLTDLEESLERLETDYIDVYYAHRVPAEEEQIASFCETINEIRKAGKIRAFGISNATPEILRSFLKYTRVDIVQEKYNLLDNEAEKEYLPLCEKNSISFHGYNTLARGLFTGKIGRDYTLVKGEARSAVKWFQEEARNKVIDMVESWSDICSKYSCKPSELALACSLKISDRFIALIGARSWEHFEENIGALDLALSTEDFELVRSRAAGVKALVNGQ